ncbi:MAG: N-acetyl-gamma-glutamyl-phosphate reductase common form [Planctomycetota bacterium]|jgi:N-acetyl-gamma-glutamyl-phosphate reductase common form
MKLDTIILGASGLVGAELIRLVTNHNQLELIAACSRSEKGNFVASVFPHLATTNGGIRFTDPADLLGTSTSKNPVAVLSALPHGEAAAILDTTITELEHLGREVFVVDLSADFRFADLNQWQEVYQATHGAPDRVKDFYCGLPDLSPNPDAKFVAHPGCFTTAVTMACAPLRAAGLTEDRFVAICVTGSTGSGRREKPGTHHPRRHGNMWSYQALSHRHEPEMNMLLSREGNEKAASVVFVPHSGPFSRGLHATISTKLLENSDTEEVVASMKAFYEGKPSIVVSSKFPDLKNVVGSNAVHIGVKVKGKELVVCAAIDNLLKGAAGGAIHWLNRLAGFPEAESLETPGWGWA